MNNNNINNNSNIFQSIFFDISNNQTNTPDISNNMTSFNRINFLIERIRSELPNIQVVNNNIQNLLTSTLDQKNKYKNVLSEKGNSQIKFLKYKDSDKKIKKCPILQLPFEDEDDIALLPCGHIFDKEGILQWLTEESNKCPVCRYELDSKEEKVELENNVILPNSQPNSQHNPQSNFNNFLNMYYQRQEDIMIQRAIERSLLDDNNNNDNNNDNNDNNDNLMDLIYDSEEEIDIFNFTDDEDTVD